jgi:hypothetical protein
MATTNINDVNIPRSPFLNGLANTISREWLLYLLGLGRVLYYGAFQDTTTQTASAINTPTAITFNTTDLSNGVSIGTTTSQILFANPGIYNFQFSIQLENTNNQLDDVYIWIRKNGTDVTGSAGLISVPNKHGSVNGHSISGWNYFLSVNSGDYVQIYWSTSATTTSIKFYAAQTSPVIPSTASVILTVNQVTF